MIRCPYCRSDEVTEWVKGFNMEGKKGTTYRCYACGQFFQERNIKGCGKQIFHYGDNYPALPMKKDWCKEREEHKKFKNIVPKANKDDIINLWIDLWEFLKDKTKEKK